MSVAKGASNQSALSFGVFRIFVNDYTNLFFKPLLVKWLSRFHPQHQIAVLHVSRHIQRWLADFIKRSANENYSHDPEVCRCGVLYRQLPSDFTQWLPLNIVAQCITLRDDDNDDEDVVLRRCGPSSNPEVVYDPFKLSCAFPPSSHIGKDMECVLEEPVSPPSPPPPFGSRSNLTMYDVDVRCTTDHFQFLKTLHCLELYALYKSRFIFTHAVFESCLPHHLKIKSSREAVIYRSPDHVPKSHTKHMSDVHVHTLLRVYNFLFDSDGSKPLIKTPNAVRREPIGGIPARSDTIDRLDAHWIWIACNRQGRVDMYDRLGQRIQNSFFYAHDLLQSQYNSFLLFVAVLLIDKDNHHRLTPVRRLCGTALQLDRYEPVLVIHDCLEWRAESLAHQPLPFRLAYIQRHVIPQLNGSAHRLVVVWPTTTRTLLSHLHIFSGGGNSLRPHPNTIRVVGYWSTRDLFNIVRYEDCVGFVVRLRVRTCSPFLTSDTTSQLARVYNTSVKTAVIASRRIQRRYYRYDDKDDAPPSQSPNRATRLVGFVKRNYAYVLENTRITARHLIVMEIALDRDAASILNMYPRPDVNMIDESVLLFF